MGGLADRIREVSTTMALTLKRHRILILGPEPFGVLENVDIDNAKDYMDALKRYYTEEIPDKPFSFYSSFAKAYEHLKKRAYAESYRILKERGKLYSYEESVLGAAFKPCLIWAGLNSGHRKEMDHYLYPMLLSVGLQQPLPKQNFLAPLPRSYGSVKQLDFDGELSLALYLGWTGDRERALDHLHKAFNVIPYTDKRPLFPWYQLIEVCEWLYEHSQDKCYLDIALKWAKDYQVIQPMFGWAFAFEAKYAAESKDRIRALGYALFLDPQSWRIAHFTQQEKQAAHDWFQGHNPFLTRPKA
jgi:tetratricopeptide (TPR) repeat protein